MKHEKEWYTCDRCGEEIDQIPSQKHILRRKIVSPIELEMMCDEKYAYIKTREIKPLHEKSIYTAEDLAKEVFPMAIWRDDMRYDLCPKCRKDFKRFMRNEHGRSN